MKSALSLSGLELFFSIRRSGFIIYYLVLAGALFLLVNVLGGAFSGVQTSGDVIKLNAPFFVQNIMGLVSLLTTFIVSSFAGMGALRDYRYNSYQITFSYPVSRISFVTGKFLGIYLTNLLLFTAPLVGFALGCAMPWLHRSAFLPFDFITYWNVFIQLFSVNIFFLSAFFFMLGILLRNIVVNWIAIIAFYLFYTLAGHYFNQSATRTLGALLDPYGLIGTLSVSVGQSAQEHNKSEVPLEGLYLLNRAIYLAAGCLSLWLAAWRFRFGYGASVRGLRFFRKKPAMAAPGTLALPRPVFTKRFDGSYLAKTFGNQLRMECRHLLRNVYLYLILGAALIFLYFSSSVLKGDFEASSYPITRRMAETFGSVINIFIILVLLVFSGEAVWRDAQHRITGIVNSMPASRALRMVAKTTALYLVVLVLLVLVVLAGIVYQAAHGYYLFELPLYIKYIFGYLGARYLFFTILAVGLQMLAGNKYAGYAAFGTVYIFGRFFAYDLFRHGIFTPGYTPGVIYSDLVGFNGSFFPFAIYLIYWLLAALLLWRTGIRLLPDADGEGFRERWRRLTANGLVKHTAGTWAMAGCLLLLGGYIFYNTDVLNDNHSAKYLQKLQANYEKKYGRLRTLPQLCISRVEGNIALMPAAKAMWADMKLTLVNKTGSPVGSIYLNLPDADRITNIQCSAPWQQTTMDKDEGFYGYRLARPVQPGDSVQLQYHFACKPHGFTDNGVSSLVLPNGTFMNSSYFMPVVGYNAAQELTGNELRKRYGLPAKPYAPLLSDTVAQQRPFFGTGADRVALRLTISTEKGQTAISPGYLQRQWTAGDRAYFTYEMDQPAVNFFSIQSGRYAVKTESFTVPGDSLQRPVQLSIYYHPQHAYNLDMMMQAMKDGLSYYNTAFGPYQYRQLRVVEFPEAAFAQSFANTIAFSENIGFLTDLRKLREAKPGDVDSEALPGNFTYFITLHEMAHQWWGHQILPAGTEGAQMLSEAMSQYSAVMAVKQQYGVTHARKLLEHYSFQYLSSRGSEQLEERSLERVLHQQYICYGKGMCVFYALQKYLGEARMNGVLKDFVHDYGSRGRPYVTADKLVERLKAAAPDSLKYMVTDGLERIVVYDNRLESAAYRLNPETLEYAVEAVVTGRKMVYDSKENAVEAPMADYVEVGILNANGQQVGSQIVKLHAGRNVLHFTAVRRPAALMLNPDFDLLEKNFNKAERQVPVTKL